jgi:hypothetical protein
MWFQRAVIQDSPLFRQFPFPADNLAVREVQAVWV